MNISVLFRTKYEGDLRATARMLGTEISAVIPRLPVGYSLFHLADVGDPSFSLGVLLIHDRNSLSVARQGASSSKLSRASDPGNCKYRIESK
jgi:hypothetical protein